MFFCLFMEYHNFFLFCFVFVLWWGGMVAFEQRRPPREPWWNRYWVSWNYPRQTIYFADECLCQRKWGWKYYWQGGQVSSLVWSDTRFSQLCYSVEPHWDNVSTSFIYLFVIHEFGINLCYCVISRFLVDDVPIRRYPRKSDATFPLRPMYVYGSIWDASSWATEDGKYKADYQYQPFVGRYTNFKLGGCTADESVSCRPPSASASGSTGLSQQQYLAMEWAQKNYLVYDYCRDPKRDHTFTPEC